MRLILLCFCAAFAAVTATAQTLDPRWEVVGSFTLDIGGAPASLHAVRDTETGETTVAQTVEDGSLQIRIAGVTPGQEGKPGVPILTITLGPVGVLGAEVRQVELREAERVLMASPDSETEARIGNLFFGPGGAISFDFAADLVVMAPTADGGHAPLAGAVGLPIMGRFEGFLPNR